MSHNSVKFNIKGVCEVEVDEKIVPLLKWVNAFDGVYSIFSCERTEPQNGTPFSYCSFVCFNNESLKKIIQKENELVFTTDLNYRDYSWWMSNHSDNKYIKRILERFKKKLERHPFIYTIRTFTGNAYFEKGNAYFEKYRLI